MIVDIGITPGLVPLSIISSFSGERDNKEL
jgi:hypothetical protein